MPFAKVPCAMDSRPSAALSARLLCSALLAVSLGSAGCTGLFPVAAEAPTLSARPGCSLWNGTIKGNDPNAGIELELCPIAPDGARIAGRVQFKSTRSGWSVREVEGTFSEEGVLTMRETQFDVSEPEL